MFLRISARQTSATCCPQRTSCQKKTTGSGCRRLSRILLDRTTEMSASSMQRGLHAWSRTPTNRSPMNSDAGHFRCAIGRVSANRRKQNIRLEIARALSFSKSGTGSTHSIPADPSNQRFLMIHLFFRCQCHARKLSRIHRRMWMRLLPGMRLYRCANCQRQQLLSRRFVDRARVIRDGASASRED